jgi:hypothetical protein
MRYFMIRGYSDHAANELTFLAWVRTGIAVIAFGFVIEKFNLFVLTMANANALDAGRRLQLERLLGPLGRYDGLALILLGMPWLWSQPRALCVPGSCSMTRRHIPSAASAQSCSCRRRWR